jgi:acyl-CoA thioesterase FadM
MSAPHGHRVQMRWQDLDGLGHVNHNVALTYLEEGRDSFLEARGVDRNNYVVGRCSVNYLNEIDPGQREVLVECGVSRLGRSSVTTSERILGGEGEVLVEAEFGLVLWDAEQGSPRPMTEGERAALAAGVEDE